MSRPDHFEKGVWTLEGGEGEGGGGGGGGEREEDVRMYGVVVEIGLTLAGADTRAYSLLFFCFFFFHCTFFLLPSLAFFDAGQLSSRQR